LWKSFITSDWLDYEASPGILISFEVETHHRQHLDWTLQAEHDQSTILFGF
jgi:hypothetical protein